MKEVNGIINGTIKMINSIVVAEIIFNSGYFEEVQDISNELSSENTMVFDVYVDLDNMLGEPVNKSLKNIDKSFEVDEDSLYEIVNMYMDIAVEDIMTMIKDHLNVTNITSSFSINQLDDGISALIYVYFGEYYLNRMELH